MCATRNGILCQRLKNTFWRCFGCRLAVPPVLCATLVVGLEFVPRTLDAEWLSMAQLERLSDEELMACLKTGQSDALAILFGRYQKLVLSIALKIVRDPAEAEDVTQTVFLDIYRAVAQFDPRKGNTKVWLMQYAYHRALNRRQHLQSRKFYKITELKEEERETRPLKGHATFRLSSPETQALVRQSMAALSDKQRSVIEMACYEGLSMREIADRSGDSFVSVRHHYYRGLQALRSFISGDDKRTSGQGENSA
jgi:RNA polymerase sigma-70 factor (ECF subfamily)